MRKFRKFFHSKKIVYTSKLAPAELVKRFEHKGKKYVRVAFTNRVKYVGSTPITDVHVSQIIGIRKLPSPFKKKVFGMLGLKPRATYYSFRKDLKTPANANRWRNRIAQPAVGKTKTGLCKSGQKALCKKEGL